MSFNENARLDTSQVESGGSSGGGFGGGGGSFPGGMKVGGGIGGIILLILALLFGGDVLGGSSGTGTSAGSSSAGDVTGAGAGSSGNTFSECQTGADANKNDTCLVIGTVNSVQNYWEGVFSAAGKTYTPAKTVIYSGTTQSACGSASNQVGPFYCPVDGKVYVDASFYDILAQQFGSSTGNLAKEYVVAHEYGHHVQDLLGYLGQAQQDPQGAQSGAVRVELMADCLAGVWAKNASTTKDVSGTPFLNNITQQDLTDALSAAKSVGDDHIQSTMGSGQVNPESWTHGSSAARQRWFLQGYKAGSINSCDTFSPQTVE
ncbi:MAG: neutral zinc metallopeptidase [Nostocoides sp.]